MTVQVLYHGRCFDGIVSAALFTAFYRSCIDSRAFIRYQACTHKNEGPYHSNSFSASVNAVVDFRYSSDSELHWWFDHHQSSFLTPEDREHFEEGQWRQRFWDERAPSCASFLAKTVQKEYGFDPTPHEEAIQWADQIDAALFPDAATAVDLSQPALQIMHWIECNKATRLTNQIIDQFARAVPLKAIAQHQEIQQTRQELQESQAFIFRMISQKAKIDQNIATIDLCSMGFFHYNKFAPYHLFPDCQYSLLLTQTDYKTKISVGINPWNVPSSSPSIAKICERYGGGGHRYVGGIILPPNQHDRIQEIAREIVQELKQET